MKRGRNPSLTDWAIVRISPIGYDEFTAYHFTGICTGHPLLADGARIVTTAVQEIAEDGKRGRSRSRAYELGRKLELEEFTVKLEAEVMEILCQVFGVDCDLEWISVEEWREVAALNAIDTDDTG